MKKILRIAGIVLWVVGVIWVVYIMGEVFSRAEGFTTLSGLVGPVAFHIACMFLGGFCFVTGTQKAPEKAAEKKPAPQV